MHHQEHGWRHPFDLDDSDELAELLLSARKNMLGLTSLIMDFVDESPKSWGVAFAIGTNNCAGRSMSEVAARLGCTRADISHHAREFIKIAKIPPSPYMKAERVPA